MSVEDVKPGSLPDDLPDGADSAGAGTDVKAGEGTGPVRDSRLRAVMRGHTPFYVVLALGAVLRAVVMLGYPPARFYPDSYSYLSDSVTGLPDMVRGNGYPFLLKLLEPLHSFNLITGLQALMGLVLAVLIYLVLRRRGLPGWGATLCVLPVLFDVYELQLEHMIASDVLFYTLVTVAVALLCFWDTPPWGVVVFAGVLVGYASTVRNVGEAMLAVVLVGMIARRMGWKRIVAAAAAGVVPIAAYMIWFHSYTGQYAMNEAGPFLYARVQTFANCAQMNPAPNLRPLCDPRPPGARKPSQQYIWNPKQPLMELTGGHNNKREFTPKYSKMSKQFAEAAIESQPLSYAKTVARDTIKGFDWYRIDANEPLGNVMGTGSMFQFGPSGAMPAPSMPGTPAYRAASELHGVYAGKAATAAQMTSPWAKFLWRYQHVYLRGPFLLVIILIGLAGVLGRLGRRSWRERRWGGVGLLPWLVGASLIVLPPMTAGFSYRYSLSAVPALCLAAGLAFAASRARRRDPVTWVKKRRGKSADLAKEG